MTIPLDHEILQLVYVLLSELCSNVSEFIYRNLNSLSLLLYIIESLIMLNWPLHGTFRYLLYAIVCIIHAINF